MARLQVLYLPDRQLGPEEFERRFGLVLDELDGPLSDDERADLDAFGQQVGAAGVYTTSRSLDCDQGDDSGAMDEFVANLRQLVDERIGETVQATLAQQQKPTAEPKAARTWGTVERDPRESIPGWRSEVARRQELDRLLGVGSAAEVLGG